MLVGFSMLIVFLFASEVIFVIKGLRKGERERKMKAERESERERKRENVEEKEKDQVRVAFVKSVSFFSCLQDHVSDHLSNNCCNSGPRQQTY